MVCSPRSCSTPVQTQTGGRKFCERSRHWNPARNAALGGQRVLLRTACEGVVALPTRAGAESVTHRHNEPRTRVIRREPFSRLRCRRRKQQGDQEIRRKPKTVSDLLIS